MLSLMPNDDFVIASLSCCVGTSSAPNRDAFPDDSRAAAGAGDSCNHRDRAGRAAEADPAAGGDNSVSPDSGSGGAESSPDTSSVRSPESASQSPNEDAHGQIKGSY